MLSLLLRPYIRQKPQAPGQVFRRLRRELTGTPAGEPLTVIAERLGQRRFVQSGLPGDSFPVLGV